MEALSTTVMECALFRALKSQYAVDNPIIPPPTITTAEPSGLFCLLAAIYPLTSRYPDWPLSKDCVLLPGQLAIETGRRAIGCELDVVKLLGSPLVKYTWARQHQTYLSLSLESLCKSTLGHPSGKIRD